MKPISVSGFQAGQQQDPEDKKQRAQEQLEQLRCTAMAGDVLSPVETVWSVLNDGVSLVTADENLQKSGMVKTIW